jgi:hypothetical protein
MFVLSDQVQCGRVVEGVRLGPFGDLPFGPPSIVRTSTTSPSWSITANSFPMRSIV